MLRIVRSLPLAGMVLLIYGGAQTAEFPKPAADTAMYGRPVEMPLDGADWQLGLPVTG